MSNSSQLFPETKTKKEEWEEIENLVMEFKKVYSDEYSEWEKEDFKMAGWHLIEKFMPLFKKYFVLLKTGQIDFEDAEMKRFVLSFIGDASLKAALKRDKQCAAYRHPILARFNFVRETYGQLADEEIMTNLQMLFLTLAKRYKQMGKNFCAYVYNAYCYEVSRHIKKFIKDPANIHYKNIEYEDYMQTARENVVEEATLHEKTYENEMGIPDISWISGENCSDIFATLSPLERKLIIKYYLEDYNDRQIAEEFGMHINTVNQKRRRAVLKLARSNGIDEKSIKRNRKSGKKAMLSTEFSRRK